MKKVKNIFHKIANADPMIWGYVMLSFFFLITYPYRLYTFLF